MFIYSLSGLELTGEAGGAAIEIEDNETTARTAVYQTFGRIFLPVGDDEWEIASDGAWSKELASAGTLLEYSWEIGDQPVPADRASTEGDYERLFATALQSGTYADDADRNRDEVVRFYEYFGLKTSEDARPLDHLVTQCDFMQFLTYKEAAAGSDRLRGSFRRAQLDFLDRQLSVWLPKLSTAVAGDSSAFYAWATAALVRYVEADHAYVKKLLGA